MADESDMTRTGSIALMLCSVLLVPACDSPWEQPSLAAAAERDAVKHEIFADGAGFAKWVDKRPRSQITHGMLVIDGPKERKVYYPPNSTVVITTTSDTIARKADELVSEAIAVPKGMKTNYALGTTVDVRIERLLEGGQRELIDEGRVSFVELIKH